MSAQGYSLQRNLFVVLIAGLVLLGGTVALPASDTKSPDPNTIPVIDGGLGTCSVGFTVTDASNSPIYNAKIRVRIAYGAFGFHKLDLEVGTNSNGKARFDGLPEKVRRPLDFLASHGDREATVTHDPEKNCKADYTLVLKNTGKN